VLQPIFENGGNGSVSSLTIRERHTAALNAGKIKQDFKTGIGADALASGTVMERVYNVPYLAHAAMEPLNATALYKRMGRSRCGRYPGWARIASFLCQDCRDPYG